MAATGRPAARRACTAAAAVFLFSTAWAQPDRTLDLRVPPAGAPSAGPSVCSVCGEIRSIREVHLGRATGTQAGPPKESVGSQPGSDDWRVVGAVAYLPLGAPKNDEGWRFGAVGTPEMQAQFGESSYEVAVLMDSGERRTIQRRDGSRFNVGQRVRLRDGELEPMFP